MKTLSNEASPKLAHSPAIGEFAVTELQKARELNAELVAALEAACRLDYFNEHNALARQAHAALAKARKS